MHSLDMSDSLSDSTSEEEGGVASPRKMAASWRGEGSQPLYSGCRVLVRRVFRIAVGQC